MCTREIKAYQNPSGGRPIFGWEGEKNGYPEIELPCGKCPECCKDYYTQWATRGSRELAQWDCSLFITLTYDDENLPKDRSLKKRDVQNFIKRVKKRFRSSKENPIRQIYCGEYGSRTLRPHYHVILFNMDFPDKRKHRISDQGYQIFVSEELNRLWKKGHAEFGFAEPASIAYLFKYILKKKTRKEKRQPRTLELPEGCFDVEHEFIEASRNPGIGAWMRGSDTLKKGFLTVNGVKKKIPKYYLEDLKKNNPEAYEKIKNDRFDYYSQLPSESPLRKRQKEEAQKLLTDTKKRL